MLIEDFYTPAQDGRQLDVPLYRDSVQAGFPSPAESYIENTLSLDDLCIRKPAATYFVRAAGSSMEKAGIFDGDVLVVDRSLPASHRRIVIATVDGEFLCKRLDMSDPNKPVLRAENDGYPDIVLNGESELEIFGVVTTVVHPV
jgi:DNA polymerase V